MREKFFHSIFVKMTAFFVLFGMIPLALISLLFFYWYYHDVEESTRNNYTQIAEYARRNLDALILKADDLAAYLYEFSGDGYEHLCEILKEEEPNQAQREQLIHRMLQDMMLSNENISSLRFYTRDGKGYALFRVQGKSIQEEAGILNEVEFSGENLHDMVLMPACSEEDYYTNTKDVVFSVVRSCLDTSSVKSIAGESLGTLYIDISVETVQKLLEAVKVGERGSIYVVNPRDNQWIYSSDPRCYKNREMAEQLLWATQEAAVRQGKYWYFAQEIENTNYLVILKIFSEDVLDTYNKNRTYIMTVLLVLIVILSVAYIRFSEKMNGPVQQLHRAMQQVQTGDLKVQVEIRTGDEMEALGEGFNQMVKDLDYYIREVYVAKICQKEAELDALKMQIQPHYLYNTLDVIRMTAVENEDQKTARLLESLAKQLRYVIGQSRERVPLYMELDSIREYMVLMNARYQGKFRLNVNVSDQDRNLYVLKLLLQPMVENAIKHGLRDKEGIGTIEVNVKRGTDALEIAVLDDGKGMNAEEEQYLRSILNRKGELPKDGDRSVGIGFRNVQDRIQLSCKEGYGVDFTSCEHVGTMVKFRLPLWESEQEK